MPTSATTPAAIINFCLSMIALLLRTRIFRSRHGAEGDRFLVASPEVKTEAVGGAVEAPAVAGMLSTAVANGGVPRVQSRVLALAESATLPAAERCTGMLCGPVARL